MESKRLVARMHELVQKYPRYGYRMISAKLRREGWGMKFRLTLKWSLHD